MAGWRRQRFKGSRPGNFSKISTGESLSFEDEEENENQWDPAKNKDFHNLKSINDALRASLEHVVTNSGIKTSAAKGSKTVNKNKRLAHLNGLVRLWNIKKDLETSEGRNSSVEKNISDASDSDTLEKVVENQSQTCDHSLHIRELLLCLRIPLIHESSEIRASTLKAIRLLLCESEHVDALKEMNIHYLIARSLDIDLDNKVERIQALKLIRRCAQISAKDIPISLARAIVALVEGGLSEGDRLYRAALCICCELSILHSNLFIKANGISALTHAVLDCSTSRVAESVLGCLAALHNDPETRFKAKIQLGIIVAPFTEFRYVHSAHAPAAVLGPGPGPGPGGGNEMPRDPGEERDFRFQCAETAIISMLRSWPGVLQMTEPGATNGVSHLQALIDILYLDNSYVRKKILLLLYDVLSIKAPSDCSNFFSALEATNPTSFRESWKLAEDFVAGEGSDILPRLAKSRPNLRESHVGYILASLLKTELPDALIKVIVNADSDELSILATILLGEVLHLAHVLLPRELNATSHCLPALLAEVSSTNAVRSNRASEAVDALHRLHDIKKRGPVGNSLFLNQILAGSSRSVGRESFIGDRLHLPANWSELLRHEPAANERINSSIRDSQVNNITVDPDTAWDWDLITSVFKWPSDSFRSMDTSDNRNFLKKVVEFFKPSGNKFSTIELKLSNGKHNKRSRFLAKTGCYILDFLVSDQSMELSKMLDAFLFDIKYNFKALIDAASTHDCFLSPTRVATTTCQYYFLFVGRLSRSEIGRQSLDKHQILQSLTMMLSLRSDLYLKLVISSLDYSTMDWGSRILLSKALTKDESESCRLYATRFLGVLIRSRTSNVAQWGINLLVFQLFDASKTIAWTALNILEDACDDKMNLEAVVCAIKSRSLSDLNHLGLKGVLLYTRFLSSNNGFDFLTEKDEGAFLKMELERWNLELNLKYVSLIEELLNDGLSRHQLNETRSYGRRSRETYSAKDVFVPPHLYGQLALTPAGLEILIKEKAVGAMIKLLVDLCSNSSPSIGALHNVGGIISVNRKDWGLVKSAIWATAHISSSSIGAKWVDKQGGIAALINIAEKCDVYSLRGTAFFALGLAATNKYGCQLLSSNGWCSLRYGRNEQSPVIEDWFQRNTQPCAAPIYNVPVEKSLDEESDAVCSSLGTSLSDPEAPLKLSSEPPHEPTISLSKKTANHTRKNQQQLTPERDSDWPGNTTISSSKRKSWILRSFSLGKEDVKETDELKGNIDRKTKQSDGRRSFTLPKRIGKLRRDLFPNTRSPSKEEDNNPSSPIAEHHTDVIAKSLEEKENANNMEPIHTTAPFATPEDSSDSCSDKAGTSLPLGNIQEESIACTKTESMGCDKDNLIYKKQILENNRSSFNQIKKDSHNIILVEAEVSNADLISEQNFNIVATETSIIDHSPVSLSHLNSQVPVERKTLSPIASSTSISAMGVSGDEGLLKASTTAISICAEDTEFESSSSKHTASDTYNIKNDSNSRIESETPELLNAKCKTISIAPSRSNPRTLPPVPFRRTSKRAFSESEAQNVSHITRNTTNVPTSLFYWTGDRSTRSEHSYCGTHRNVTPVGVPKISLISGAQHGTGYPIETPITGLCTSVTSVSSNGSWTENPGKKIVDSLRKRPQLIDNETLTTIDGMTKANPSGGSIAFAQEYNRHNQRVVTGLFNSSEGRVSTGTYNSNTAYGAQRRRDSIAQKFQSLDYRFRLKYHLHARGQGNDFGSFLAVEGTGDINCSGSKVAKNSQIVRPLEPFQSGQEPSYWGITFPARIEVLFSNPHHAPISRSASKRDSLKSLTDDETEFNIAINDLTITSVSAAYRIPNLLVNRGLTLHAHNNCLSCFKLLSEHKRSIHTSPKSSPIPKALQEVVESFSTVPNIMSVKTNFTVKPTEESNNKGIIDKVADAELKSPKEDKIGNIAEENDKNDKILEALKRKEVLKLVGCMNATVGAKTAEQGLLRLKQKHPHIFTDLCLYSEVCLLLSEYSFRLFSRRFLQELFMDVDFKELYKEPYKILGITDQRGSRIISPCHEINLAENVETSAAGNRDQPSIEISLPS